MPDARYKTCPERSRRIRTTTGLTLVEMVIAMALMVIIFAAILPQFRAILNSWDAKSGAAETLQNGRVLIDHLNRNLSKAVKIISVSDPNQTNGFIVFQDYDGNSFRYDINSTSSYVEFGLVGDLSDLAGPVSSLQFACYDGNDFTTTTTDVNSIRFVDVETTLTNSSEMGQDKTFTASAYLRVNAHSLGCWQDEDIGDVGAAGSAAFLEDTLTIEGSGLDIWDYTDEFHYVYQPLSGDGQIVARVVSMTNTNSWAKAGVMIRETLDGNSKHAMMVVTPGNGTAFQRRLNTGGVSTHSAGSGVAPYWVKLKRVGNVFTGYASLDGSTWTLIDTDTVTMAADIYIGLAVTSHNDGAICSADFNNISFVTYENFSERKTTADAASLDINVPSGTISGDLLIAAVATDGSTTFPLPSEWTEIDQGSAYGQVTLGAWWKIAGSEPASHTFTWTGNRSAYGWMMRFTGHDPATPIHNSVAGVDLNINPTSPAVDSTIDCPLILRLGAFDDSYITVDSPGLAGHSPITMDSGSGTSPAAPTYRAAGAITSGTGAITPALPAGRAVNDILLLFLETSNQAISIANQNGGTWAEVANSPQGTGVAAGATGARLTVFWSRYNGTQGAPTTTDSGDHQAGRMIAVRGVITSGDPWDVTAGGVEAVSDTSGSIPGATTTVANTLVVTAIATSLPDATGTTNFSAWANGSLAGLTERIDNTRNPGNGGGIGVATGTKATAGAYVNTTVTCGSAAYKAMMSIALKPVPANTVSGGAGFVRQSLAGSSGTSSFSLTSASEARMLTIAIAPDGAKGDACCGIEILP